MMHLLTILLLTSVINRNWCFPSSISWLKNYHNLKNFLKFLFKNKPFHRTSWLVHTNKQNNKHHIFIYKFTKPSENEYTKVFHWQFQIEIFQKRTFHQNANFSNCPLSPSSCISINKTRSTQNRGLPVGKGRWFRFLCTSCPENI